MWKRDEYGGGDGGVRVAHRVVDSIRTGLHVGASGGCLALVVVCVRDVEWGNSGRQSGIALSPRNDRSNNISNRAAGKRMAEMHELQIVLTFYVLVYLGPRQ